MSERVPGKGRRVFDIEKLCDTGEIVYIEPPSPPSNPNTTQKTPDSKNHPLDKTPDIDISEVEGF